MANWTLREFAAPNFLVNPGHHSGVDQELPQPDTGRVVIVCLPSDLSGAPININHSLSKMPFLPVTEWAQLHLGLYSCQLIFITPEAAVAAWPVGGSLRREDCWMYFSSFAFSSLFAPHKLLCVTAAICLPLWFFVYELHSPAPTWEVLFSLVRRCVATHGPCPGSFPVALGWISSGSKGTVEGASKPFWLRFVSVVQCLIHPKHHLSFPAAATGSQRYQVWKNAAWPVLST